MNSLCARNITFKYLESSKKNILDNYSLLAEGGKITLLRGASGCGKSTLAYIMAGLYPENGGALLSGEVFVGDVNIHSLTPDKRAGYVGMMFQNCDLQFCMNNLKNELLFCLENISSPPERSERIIDGVAASVGIRGLLERDFNKMSGGEKQKCALCCILALNPKCIILDEAFSNVDTQSAKEIIGILKATGATILAIDHNAGLWEGACDNIVNMDGEERRASPQTPPIKRRAFAETALSVCNLSINGIAYPDMDFIKGGITAILGKSGRGKTTFFKTVITRGKYSGRISFLGRELSKQKRGYVFSKCGIVFQNPSNQFLAMSVYDEILFGVKQWNADKDAAWQARRAGELLEAFDLGGYKSYPPYLLSQGQQRRLAVLSMLAGGQEILLLDEPTYGQDYENSESIMRLLAERAANGLTVIFNTHNERVAERFADKIINLGG